MNPNDINSILDQTADTYNIPRAVMHGQFAAEGRLQGLGASRNNFFNIAAFDSNPNAATHYETPQQGIEAFAKFITGQADNYASPDVQKKFQQAHAQNQGDPVAYIRAIEQAGYAGDPKTYSKRANNGYKNYSSFVMDTPEFRNNYQAPVTTPTPTPQSILPFQAKRDAWENAGEKSSLSERDKAMMRQSDTQKLGALPYIPSQQKQQPSLLEALKGLLQNKVQEVGAAEPIRSPIAY